MTAWMDSLVARLLRFGRCTVLPAVPRVAWLLAGLAFFCVINLAFEQEIWPHHRGVGHCFSVLFFGCLASLPGLAGRTAARIAGVVTGGWQLLWKLVSWGCYVVAAITLVVFLIGCILFLR